MKIGGISMSLIDEKVLEDFSIWAEEKENKHIFPATSQKETTYFIERESEETYMMEYSFKTLKELQSGLEKYGGLSSDLQTLRMLVVGICQDRYKTSLKMNHGQDGYFENLNESTTGTISDYVYAF